MALALRNSVGTTSHFLCLDSLWQILCTNLRLLRTCCQFTVSSLPFKKNFFPFSLLLNSPVSKAQVARNTGCPLSAKLSVMLTAVLCHPPSGSDFPEHPICRLEALSIPGLFDATRLFTDEELVETLTARFIAVGFDFATILLSPSCSCILFAIVLEQLIKLEFLEQQVELKCLVLNK